MGAGACGSLPGEGLEPRRAWPGQTVPPECGEVGFVGSQGGSRRWPAAAPCWCACVCAGSPRGRWHPLGCPLSTTPARGANHLPAPCCRHSSDGCSHALCSRCVCQPSLQQRPRCSIPANPTDLSDSKLEAPPVAGTQENQPLSFSQRMTSRICCPCGFPCVSTPSLCHFLDHGSPPRPPPAVLIPPRRHHFSALPTSSMRLLLSL